MPDILINQIYLIGLAAIAGLSLIFAIFSMMIFLTIPEMRTFAKIKLLKRPLLYMHRVGNQLELHTPKRDGDRGEYNFWKLPESLGIKFTPKIGQEEILNNKAIYHYFSKVSLPFTAKQAAAVSHFRDIMGEYGIEPTKQVVDALFICNLDKDIMIPEQLSDEEIDELKGIKKELETTVVKDGLFVYQTVRDLMLTACDQNSKELAESIAIANANAIENATNGKDAKDYVSMIMVGFIALVAMVVVFKAAGFI